MNLARTLLAAPFYLLSAVLFFAAFVFVEVGIWIDAPDWDDGDFLKYGDGE